MTRKPVTPSGLSARAKRVWSKTLDEYELREDELSILADYVQELTIIDGLQGALKNVETLVKASHGGIQVNPIYSEIRMHRTTAIQLLKALKLPELGEENDDVKVTPMTRQDSARKAANARWNKNATA